MKSFFVRFFKHVIIVSILLSTSATISLAKTQLDQQAQTWVNTYIFTEDGTPRISHNNIQIIVNLIYLSWYRSAITIKAQQEILEALNIIWKGWQNIAQTRLDPSIDLPYSITPEQQEPVYKRFWTLSRDHRSIGITYTYAVKMILEKQILDEMLALDGIAAIRDKARKVVIESLLDIRKQLGEFFHIDNKNQELSENNPSVQQTVDPDIDLDETKKSINLADYIYAYIPQLTLHSFVEATNLHNLLSENGWMALKTIQEIGNQTWKTIEEARTDFYHAYYTALFNAIKKYKLPDLSLMLMFNEQGIIQKNEQDQLLPEPSKLTLPDYL